MIHGGSGRTKTMGCVYLIGCMPLVRFGGKLLQLMLIKKNIMISMKRVSEAQIEAPMVQITVLSRLILRLSMSQDHKGM